MNIRRVIFWCHLTVGSLAGIVILTMCATGVLLAFQRQIIHFAERSNRVDAQPNTPALPLKTLLTSAGNSQPSAPASITWRANPSEPVEIAFSREQSLLLNPYTGAVLGEGAVHTRAFFHTVEDCHRWLALAPANRATGRAVTGACNVGFLFLVCSGPYLWLPKTWSRISFRAGIRFNSKLVGKARDFNWHNVIGFWCCIPLAVIVMCSVVMSYPWANNLVYRATNNPPPAQNFAQPSTGGPANSQRNRKDASAAASSNSWENLDTLQQHAEQRVTGWQTITLRFPAPTDPNATFSIDSGNGGRPDKRAQLTLNRATAAEVRFEPFSSYNSGRRLRAWIRFTHTGEAAGMLGQGVAALAALGGTFLVWTGLSLAIRRLRAKMARREYGTAAVPMANGIDPISLAANRYETYAEKNISM